MTATITVTVDTAGNAEISVAGFKGSGCKALTRDLERALGKESSSTPTKERYERPERQKVRE